MPPKVVKVSTINVPITIPACSLINWCVIRLNINPSALICAATHPRYEMTIAIVVKTSIVLLYLAL